MNTTKPVDAAFTKSLPKIEVRNILQPKHPYLTTLINQPRTPLSPTNPRSRSITQKRNQHQLTIPKIKLHAHLSGSISRQCLHELWLQKRAADPTFDLPDPWVVMPPGKVDYTLDTCVLPLQLDS